MRFQSVVWFCESNGARSRTDSHLFTDGRLEEQPSEHSIAEAVISLLEQHHEYNECSFIENYC